MKDILVEHQKKWITYSQYDACYCNLGSSRMKRMSLFHAFQLTSREYMIKWMNDRSHHQTGSKCLMLDPKDSFLGWFFPLKTIFLIKFRILNIKKESLIEWDHSIKVMKNASTAKNGGLKGSF